MPEENRETATVNLEWSRALIDELVRSGVAHFCVSPGSRSTPLVLAVAERTEPTTSVHVDERSAAFFALGYARGSGRPSAVVCTSGTAVANCLPAVVEASQGGAPMVILSADRPPELRDTGASQAIDQNLLFGRFARWFVDVPTPSPEPAMLRYLRSVASRAVAVATGRPAGPVHLNLPFREPLAPAHPAAPPRTDTAPSAGRPGSAPWVTVRSAPPGAADPAIDELAERVEGSPRGLVLAGAVSHPDEAYAEAVVALAARAGYPILAEPTGGLRFGTHDRSQVIAGYDAFLRCDTWARAHAPDLVIRFGRSFTWKHVVQFLAECPPGAQVIVDPDGRWDDPTRRAAIHLACDETALARAIALRLGEGGRESRLAPPAAPASRGLDVDPGATGASAATAAGSHTGWLAEWLEAGALATASAREAALAATPGTSAWVYRSVLDSLPDGALVFVANSMAVRDLDTFSEPCDRRLRVLANRGAAGIDGTVSTALGAALGAGAPTVVVTGDLAFVHDWNGLGAASGAGIDATIVVLNDGGGGIFAHLGIADGDRRVFERFFRVPSGVRIAEACAARGLPHVMAPGPEELRGALADSLGREGTRVIEVPLDMDANTSAHRRHWSGVVAALERQGGALGR